MHYKFPAVCDVNRDDPEDNKETISIKTDSKIVHPRCQDDRKWTAKLEFKVEKSPGVENGEDPGPGFPTFDTQVDSKHKIW